MAAQLILGLSILVGVHEMGHLLAAKAFGMRVEKFSIGFPPKIWGFQYGETEYSFGAVPLGGFVKISGMIDESMDTEAMAAEPQEWEFRSKPAWQRLVVMMGGIIVNVVTGIIIFVFLNYSGGEQYLTKEALNEHGIVAYPLGEDVGFKTGDKVLKVNGADYNRFSDLISTDVILAENSTYTIQRQDSVFSLTLPSGFLDMYADKKKYEDGFIGIRLPFSIGEIQSKSEAEKGGLKSGDTFITINGIDSYYFNDFKKVLTDNKDKDVKAVVKTEKGEKKTLNLHVTEDGTLGFFPVALLDYSSREYSFGESVSTGTADAFGVIFLNIKAFGKIFRGEISASNSVSGPIGIAKMFGGTWEWEKFWRLVGMLSMVLAFMNFLPIPALDGGHVVFLTYEIVSGRKPSDNFLENAQKVGMVILLGLMGFAFFNDIFKEMF